MDLVTTAAANSLNTVTVVAELVSDTGVEEIRIIPRRMSNTPTIYPTSACVASPDLASLDLASLDLASLDLASSDPASSNRIVVICA